MDAKEFKRRALRGGYAYAPTVNDYMELHDETYTEDDLQAVYRLQQFRDGAEQARSEQYVIKRGQEERED